MVKTTLTPKEQRILHRRWEFLTYQAAANKCVYLKHWRRSWDGRKGLWIVEGSRDV